MKLKMFVLKWAFVLVAGMVPVISNGAIHTHDAGNYRHARAWIPDDVKILRGVIVNVNGDGDDNRGYANDPDYQAFARNLEFAIVGVQNFSRDMPGEGTRLLNTLSYFASVSGHPELKNAPLLLTGFSNGANFSYNFNIWMPSRVIAFAGNKGGYYGDQSPAISAVSFKTPGMLVFGEYDTRLWDGFRIVFNAHRPKGALWSIAMEKGRGHEKGLADAMFLPFFQKAVAMRYPANQNPLSGPVQLLDVAPASGWIGDLTTWGLKNSGASRLAQIYPFSSCPFTMGSSYSDPVLGTMVRDAWLLDQNNACNWRAFASYDNPIRITSPAPSLSPNHSRLMLPTYSEGASVTLNVDASVFTSWSRLELYDGAVKLKEITSGPTQFVMNNLTAGTHTFMIIGTNASGQVRTSQPCTVVVRGSLSTAPVPEPSPSPEPVVQTLPSPWISTAVGNPGLQGTGFTNAPSSFVVKGSGLDIWGSSDSFQFVSRPMRGDGSIIVELKSMDNTDAWAKSGIMIRESLSSNARHAFLAVTPANGIAFQCRTVPGGSTSHTATTGAAPRWLRLQRKGNLFSASKSGDGISWTLIGSTTILMNSDAQMGMAVTSHNNAKLCSSSFANVKVNMTSPWLNQDIGIIGVAGGVASTDSTFTVKGSGTDIWGGADGFHMMYRPLNGDGSITARVVSQQNTNPWAKAGVMIRETLSSNSRHVSLLTTPSNGIAFHSRTSIGGSTTYSGSSGASPFWLRLVRAGNTISAYRSTDGLSWTLVSKQDVSMALSVYAGLAVTSHANNILSTVTFDHVN